MLIDCIACTDGVPPGGGVCVVCSGSGEVEIATSVHDDARWQIHCVVWAYLLEKAGGVTEAIGNLALLDNVFYSHVVLEALDQTEHAALSAGEKEGVNILLMCGRVDLNDGKAGKVRLWNWFGAESTTVANLTALLS